MPLTRVASVCAPAFQKEAALKVQNLHSSPKICLFTMFLVKPTQWAKHFTQVVKRKATHTR